MTRLLARIPVELRATALYALAMAWSKGLAFLTLPVLTTALAPAEFGRLELLSSAAEIGGLIAGLGLVDTLYRFAAEPGEAGRKSAARITGLALLGTVLAVAVIVALAPAIASGIRLPTPSLDIVLLGVAVAVEAAIGVPLGWLRMQGRAGAFTALTVARGSVQAGLVVVLVLTGHGVTGVLMAGAIASVALVLVLAGMQARDTGISIAPRASLRLLAYGIPLIGSGLASFVLGTADRWVLVGDVPAASLGHYALACKLSLIVALLMQPFDLWWYPQRLKLLTQPDGLQRSGRVVGFGAALLLLAGGATALTGPALIDLLTRAAYAPAKAFLPWLVLALVLQMLASLANVGSYAARVAGLPLAVNAAAACVALGLYLALIPGWGVAGAIAATLAAQAVRLGLFVVLSQRRVAVPWQVGRLLPVALCATAAAATPQLFGTGTLGLLTGIAALGLGVAAAAIGGLLPLPRLSRPATPLRPA
jgi:O-antigen/teichoic acid export membrane protein